jgi:hypothetical protein
MRVRGRQPRVRTEREGAQALRWEASQPHHRPIMILR